VRERQPRGAGDVHPFRGVARAGFGGDVGFGESSVGGGGGGGGVPNRLYEAHCWCWLFSKFVDVGEGWLVVGDGGLAGRKDDEQGA